MLSNFIMGVQHGVLYKCITRRVVRDVLLCNRSIFAIVGTIYSLIVTCYAKELLRSTWSPKKRELGRY